MLSHTTCVLSVFPPPSRPLADLPMALLDLCHFYRQKSWSRCDWAKFSHLFNNRNQFFFKALGKVGSRALVTSISTVLVSFFVMRQGPNAKKWWDKRIQMLICYSTSKSFPSQRSVPRWQYLERVLSPIAQVAEFQSNFTVSNNNPLPQNCLCTTEVGSINWFLQIEKIQKMTSAGAP